MTAAPITATAAIALPLPPIAPQRMASGAASLLPRPQQALSGIEAIYAAMVEASAVQQKNGKVDVQNKFVTKRIALEKYVAHLQKAADDRNSSGFLKTLAKVGMVVAAVAATVASYGAAGPVVVAVAIALSAGGFFVNETKCFGDASPWIGMGMQICGSVMTGGAGGGGAAMSVSSSASATSTMVSGAATIKDAANEHEADMSMREAKAAQQQMRRLQVAIDDIIANLKDDKDATDRKGSTINQIVQTQGDTLVAASGGRV